MASGRRPTGFRPQVINQPWGYPVQRELQDWIDSQWASDADGIPAGFEDVTPTTVEADVTSDPGTESEGWAAADHSHGVTTGAPTNPTGTAAAEGTGAALMRADATIEQGIVTTKGDVLTHSSVPARLAVGANNTVLVASSGQTVGLKWAYPCILPCLVTTTSTNLNLWDAHYVVLVNASGASRTMNLPATATSGRMFVIKKIDASANAVVISGNGNNVDGAASASLTAQYESIQVVGDGSDWWII